MLSSACCLNAHFAMFRQQPARLDLTCQCQTTAACSLLAYLTGLQPHTQLQHNA